MMRDRWRIFIDVPRGMGEWGSCNLFLGIVTADNLPEWIDAIESAGHIVRIFYDGGQGICLYQTGDGRTLH